MLKGWAMLADECPGSDCYGIPLVRPPKAGGSIDPRKASTSAQRADALTLISHIAGMCDLRCRVCR